jgi:hypothetical protein
MCASISDVLSRLVVAGQTLSSTLQRRLITMVKTCESGDAVSETAGLAGSGDKEDASTADAGARRMPAHHNLSAKVFRQAERAEDRFLKQQKTSD